MRSVEDIPPRLRTLQVGDQCRLELIGEGTLVTQTTPRRFYGVIHHAGLRGGRGGKCRREAGGGGEDQVEEDDEDVAEEAVTRMAAWAAFLEGPGCVGFHINLNRGGNNYLEVGLLYDIFIAERMARKDDEEEDEASGGGGGGVDEDGVLNKLASFWEVFQETRVPSNFLPANVNPETGEEDGILTSKVWSNGFGDLWNGSGTPSPSMASTEAGMGWKTWYAFRKVTERSRYVHDWVWIDQKLLNSPERSHWSSFVRVEGRGALQLVGEGTLVTTRSPHRLYGVIEYSGMRQSLSRSCEEEERYVIQRAAVFAFLEGPACVGFHINLDRSRCRYLSVGFLYDVPLAAMVGKPHHTDKNEELAHFWKRFVECRPVPKDAERPDGGVCVKKVPQTSIVWHGGPNVDNNLWTGSGLPSSKIASVKAGLKGFRTWYSYRKTDEQAEEN